MMSEQKIEKLLKNSEELKPIALGMLKVPNSRTEQYLNGWFAGYQSAITTIQQGKKKQKMKWINNFFKSFTKEKEEDTCYVINREKAEIELERLRKKFMKTAEGRAFLKEYNEPRNKENKK